LEANAANPQAGPFVGPDGVKHPAFHHINLKSTRIDELIEWYGLVVGAKPNFRSPAVAFLTNDAANHRIAIFGSGYEDDPDKELHTGMHHSAFEFGSLAELLGRYEWLKDQGITPRVCVDHGLTMSFYYADPDGNNVELQADNYGDWAASGEWMRTSPDFISDPIGTYVDPDQIVAALQEGIDPAEIHRRAYAGEYSEGAAGPNDQSQSG
jgi:catechol 2,3-dioxygenase